MELHIVHRTPDERLAVVGIFLEVGGENVALAPVFDNLPTEVSDEAAPVGARPSTSLPRCPKHRPTSSTTDR